MPFGVQVQVLSRAPRIKDFGATTRPKGRTDHHFFLFKKLFGEFTIANGVVFINPFSCCDVVISCCGAVPARTSSKQAELVVKTNALNITKQIVLIYFECFILPSLCYILTYFNVIVKLIILAFVYSFLIYYKV